MAAPGSSHQRTTRYGQLTREALQKHNASGSPSRHRVVAYTMDGIQCGLPGLGESEDLRLTFPSNWQVQQALNSGEWVRFATAEEKATYGTWWRPLGWNPAAILYAPPG